MIASTRSFGEKVFALEALEQAVAAFTTNAAAKLRKQRSLANCIQVFARTSGFGPGPQYGGSRIVVMPYPTDDTRDLVQGALAGLREFFKEGPAYAKAGVVLSQFEERGAVTGDMFAPSPRKGSEQVMAVLVRCLLLGSLHGIHTLAKLQDGTTCLTVFKNGCVAGRSKKPRQHKGQQGFHGFGDHTGAH